MIAWFCVKRQKIDDAMEYPQHLGCESWEQSKFSRAEIKRYKIIFRTCRLVKTCLSRLTEIKKVIVLLNKERRLNL